MNRILRMVYAATFGAMLLTACAKEVEVSSELKERVALGEWMALNRPDLVENYQAEGGYYVDVEELGSTDAKPIRDTAMWVRFSFTGRNLSGDIVLTRNEADADQVGTYTKFTHYVPFYRYYAGQTNAGLIEGTYLAMRDVLTLGEKYAAAKGYPRQVEMRYGTKVTLYMPSRIVGAVSGNGGYEGQEGYELKEGYPFVVTMQITDTVRNPLQREGVDIDRFAEANGGLRPSSGPTNPKSAARLQRAPIFDPDHPEYTDGYEWRRVYDSIPHVYVNLTYKPTIKYTFDPVYKSAYLPYSAFSELEQNIADTLVNRFGAYNGPWQADKEEVGLKGTAKIWYITRLLDGFIVDSNIPGVRRLVYGETNTKGTPMSYTPEKSKAIQAFFHTIPNLRYGQWAGIVTASTNAYGAAGTSGSTDVTSSSSDAAAMAAYYSYMNAYYGASGAYGGYYNDYYLNGMGAVDSGAITNTTITTTEVQSYTPLVFQIYIERKE